MLKKKILGAKVLDTNGFVLATRLITPNKAGGNYQLGDIYSANAIDEKLSNIEVGDNTDVSELKIAIAENKTAISDEKVRAQLQEQTINEDLLRAVKNAESESDKLETLIEALQYGLNITGSYDKDTNRLILTLWRPASGQDALLDKAWLAGDDASYSFKSEVENNLDIVKNGTATDHWTAVSSSSISLSDIIDTNDLIDSDTDTIITKDGKTSIKTNTLSKDDVQKMIDDTVNKENNK